jgi:hypothetical protein
MRLFFQLTHSNYVVVAMRYYFDLKNGHTLIPDEEGLELPDLRTVQQEAARSLADMARDAVSTFDGQTNHVMAIEVRDQGGPPLAVERMRQRH